MKSAIDMMLDGETHVDNIKVTDEWKRLANKALSLYNKFYPSLTDEQKKQFDELHDYDAGQTGESEIQHYKAGFKFGFLLAAEIFSD